MNASTNEVLNGKLHFLCSVRGINGSKKILIIHDHTIITGLQEQWLGESHFLQIAIGFAIKGLIKLRNMH